MQCYGLICVSPDSQEKPIPLQNVKVEANVVDMIAEEDKNIEALYKFPIYEAAAVCDFEAEIDGKYKIKGIVKEAKQAASDYKEAVEKGHSAYLLEEQLSDVFQCSIGNLKSNQTVVIKITYVTELKHDSENEKIRFVLPTCIAERYGSSSSTANDGKKLAPDDVKYSGKANYELDLKVNCKMTSTIQSIESPSHLISTELNVDGNSKISNVILAEHITYLDKDFVLVVKSEDLDKPRAFLEYNPKTESNCLMLTLVPKFSLNPIQTEIVFIVDRSGSMQGEPIKKAGQALELFLRSLPEDYEDEDKFFNYLFQVEGAEEEKKREKEKKEEEKKDKPVISFFSNEPQPTSTTTKKAEKPKKDVEKLLECIKLQQAPYKIPEIYPGVRFIVYCILSKDVQPSNEIILTAKSSDGPMKLNIPIDHVTLTGSKIHTLAARKLIQDLEENRSFIHKHLKSKDKTIPDYIFKDYIINLGIKYNLMSKYTRHVPNKQLSKMFKIGSISTCSSTIGSAFGGAFSVTEKEEEVNEHKKPKIEILLKFLSLQSFDGKFQPKNEFFEFFGKNSLDEFNFENNFENKDDEQQKEKLCTIIGLIYLEVVMMKDFKDECDICYEKSKTALTTKFKDYNEENVKNVMDSVRKWMNDWIKE
ncbi:5249_t:CDS:2 [Entrophospora sp. SA101]|nr:5249_t:CDS:2 [Entrophospora sp. SA101]